MQDKWRNGGDQNMRFGQDKHVSGRNSGVLTGRESVSANVVLQKEVRVITNCKHPNIIQYYSSFVKGHELWLVMELLDGGVPPNRVLGEFLFGKFEDCGGAPISSALPFTIKIYPTTFPSDRFATGNAQGEIGFLGREGLQ